MSKISMGKLIKNYRKSVDEVQGGKYANRTPSELIYNVISEVEELRNDVAIRLNEMDEMEVVMNKFNSNSIHDIVRDGFTGKEFTGDEEELLNNIKTWIETLVGYSCNPDDKQYYLDLLGEVVIISFVVKTEEVTKIDSSFFDKFS